MDSVYIKSTIPSYLTARASRSEGLEKDQKLTRLWWDTHRGRFRVYTSSFTLKEIAKGDSEAAALRLDKLKTIKSLTITPEVEHHGFQIGKALQLPPKAMLDAFHVATCVVHQVDYLLTWNCTHLANPVLQKQLIEYCRIRDLHVPVICTPEELMRTSR